MASARPPPSRRLRLLVPADPDPKPLGSLGQEVHQVLEALAVAVGHLGGVEGDRRPIDLLRRLVYGHSPIVAACFFELDKSGLSECK